MPLDIPSFSSFGSILGLATGNREEHDSDKLLSVSEMADMEISIEELRSLELSYERDLRESKSKADADIAFAYACGLIRSKVTTWVVNAQELLQKDQDRKRDALYFLSIAYYRQNDLPSARMYISEFLAMEPNNEQGLALQRLIKKKITRGIRWRLSRLDGLIGLAIVGGVAAIVTGTLFTLLSSKKAAD